MLKIYRKIRQTLLTENKFSKYMLYAIGEILLVVIGILIALQINNWNEQQKLHSNIKGIYAIIQGDLKNDIKTIDFVVKAISYNDSISKKVLNREMTRENYKNCSKCGSILSGYPDFTLNQRGINLLNANLTTFQAKQDSLSIEVSDFYSYYNTEIDVALEEVTTDYNDNRSYFKNDMSWFEDYYKRVYTDEFITYALESQDYRNRVTSFYSLFFIGYLGLLKQYKERALELIEEIDKVP